MNVVKIEVNQLEKELHKESRLIKRMQKTRESIQKKRGRIKEFNLSKTRQNSQIKSINL